MKPSIEKAERKTKEFLDISSGDMKWGTARLFNSDEINRAKSIVNALEGLTIDSAQELLAKINQYLLLSKV